MATIRPNRKNRLMAQTPFLFELVVFFKDAKKMKFLGGHRIFIFDKIKGLGFDIS